MSCACVHSAVAEPCQVSPPSSSSALRPARLQLLDQRGQVREAADLAVAPRRLLEVEVGERMGGRGARGHAGRLQQRLAHQVRQPAVHRPRRRG